MQNYCKYQKQLQIMLSKMNLMNMLKALKTTLELRSAIIIFMCLTYTKIMSNKLGIQFLKHQT